MMGWKIAVGILCVLQVFELSWIAFVSKVLSEVCEELARLLDHQP